MWFPVGVANGDVLVKEIGRKAAAEGEDHVEVGDPKGEDQLPGEPGAAKVGHAQSAAKIISLIVRVTVETPPESRQG